MTRNALGLTLRPWGVALSALSRTPEEAGLVRNVGWDSTYFEEGGNLPEGDVFNRLFAEITSLLYEITQKGILDWSGSQGEYGHPCLVWGSDGLIYISVQAGGQTRDPTLDTTFEFWRPYLVLATRTQIGQVRLSTEEEDRLGVSTTVATTPSALRSAINDAVGNMPSGYMTGEIKYLAYTPRPLPDNWLECNGQEVSRTTYSQLWAAIGTTYGVGDGTTTFNIPNLQRRVIMGSGGTRPPVTDGPNTAVGNVGGFETHTLALHEMPTHFHTSGTLRTDEQSPVRRSESSPSDPNGMEPESGAGGVSGDAGASGDVDPESPGNLRRADEDDPSTAVGHHTHELVGVTGSHVGSQPHSIVQPSMTMLAIIYAGG